MEEFSKIENLIDHAREYANARVDEAKLAAAEKTSKVIALLIAGGILGLVFFISFLFASLAASYGLGHWLGNTPLGFLLVAIAYFFLCLIVWNAREKLIRIPIVNAILQQLFKTSDEHGKD
jgi:Putative Actinobacterial Holin-X, holin superfamily III